MRVSVKYPDGSVVPFAYHDGTLIFYPAETAATNNTARIEMNPDFSQDGLYRIWVNRADVSGNSSGDGVDHRIGFEVVNKPMVSNVLTYPNPFTTQTRFVFTLTGSEVPDYIKVQILTVSGKVIREVLAPELGPLHIGTNITEFAWDGTDKFGDPVGETDSICTVWFSDWTVGHWSTLIQEPISISRAVWVKCIWPDKKAPLNNGLFYLETII